MNYDEVLKKLQALADPEIVPGAGKFGITPHTTVLGIRVPKIRALAREIKKDHALAGQLWNSGIHEARLLATMIADPKQFTSEQMDAWTASFDSWDVCDQACINVFRKTPFAIDKVVEWTSSNEEFVRRAGFALMATLAVHDKESDDDLFGGFLMLILMASYDERNFVKKAVNWALRQIGKRNMALNAAAIKIAHTIQQQDSKSAKWIAADALRELQSEKVQERLREQSA